MPDPKVVRFARFLMFIGRLLTVLVAASFAILVGLVLTGKALDFRLALAGSLVCVGIFWILTPLFHKLPERRK